METHYTVPAVAKRWDCSDRYVWHLTARGDLPALRLGRLVRIRQVDLERYEAAHVEGGQSGAVEPGSQKGLLQPLARQ